MIQYKKLLTTLALLLTAVGGAWAQSSLNVVEFEVPADWENDNSPVTAGDLPGFNASTSAEAWAWTGATSDNATLFYAFDGDQICFVDFFEGAPSEDNKTEFTKQGVFSMKSIIKFYYTAEITEWPLTPDANKKVWTLDKMPGSDIELQVEYYAESNLFLGKEALADKANIAVKNGETAVAFDDEGKSTTTVSEGNTVTATYTGTKKVIGMTVTKRKRPEFVPGATIQNLESFVEVENNRDGTITLHMPTLKPSTYNVTNSSLSNGENTLHFGYEIGSGENMSVIGANVIAKSWSDHTPFSELDKTIDITSGKPRVAIIITGHVQSATCPAPERELYWGLYRYTNPVKVTYNLGGGSVSGSTADKVEYLFSGDALATTFAAPTREGYTFDGWYTSAEGGTKLTASNASSATTIYAHWNAIAE